MSTSARYRRFLDSLYPTERRRIEAAVTAALATWPAPSKTCRPLRLGLWEIRCHLPTRIVRVIFTRTPEGLRMLEGIVKTSGAEHERAVKAALVQVRRQQAA